VVVRNEKFVKGRWAKLTFFGFRNEKWLREDREID